MSNMCFDENGYVGDFATNKGQTDFFAYLKGLDDPDLEEFINEGSYLIPEALLEVLGKYDPPRGEIKETMDNFKELLPKCKGIVIISDGLNDGKEQM